MKGKALIPLIAGLCIGGFALKMGIDTVKKAKGGQASVVQLLAPRSELARGTPITEALLTTVKFPANAVPAGAFTKKEDLIGRVPRIVAPAGLPILENMLRAKGARGGVVPPPGYRAVAVKVDESSGVDNHLQPGCRVDVVGYFNVRKAGRQVTIARTFIEDVEVAAVGEQVSPPTLTADQQDGPKRTSSTSSKPARAVTLFVRPEQVPDLHLAEQKGKLKLSMRNDVDGAPTDMTRITTEADVLGTAETDELEAAAPVAVKRVPVQDPGGGNSFARVLFGFLLPSAGGTAAPAEFPFGTADSSWKVVVYNGGTREELLFQDTDSMNVTQPYEAAGRGVRRTRPTPHATPAATPVQRIYAAPESGSPSSITPPVEEENPEPKELPE